MLIYIRNKRCFIDKQMSNYVLIIRTAFGKSYFAGVVCKNNMMIGCVWLDFTKFGLFWQKLQHSLNKMTNFNSFTVCLSYEYNTSVGVPDGVPQGVSSTFGSDAGL